MIRKVLVVVSSLFLAFVILTISILRTAAVKYELNGTKGVYLDSSVLTDKDTNIDYYLAYPGNVLPDSPMWSVKALRDKIWYLITSNNSRRAELALLFADKRVGAALILFKQGKAGDGFSTLTKAEKYLELASLLEKKSRTKGEDTSDFLVRLAGASLKHYEVMDEIYEIAPDDAKPKVIEIAWYAKRVYEDSRNALLDKGMVPPVNPFSWR